MDRIVIWYSLTCWILDSITSYNLNTININTTSINIRVLDFTEVPANAWIFLQIGFASTSSTRQVGGFNIFKGSMMSWDPKWNNVELRIILATHEIKTNPLWWTPGLFNWGHIGRPFNLRTKSLLGRTPSSGKVTRLVTLGLTLTWPSVKHETYAKFRTVKNPNHTVFFEVDMRFVPFLIWWYSNLSLKTSGRRWVSHPFHHLKVRRGRDLDIIIGRTTVLILYMEYIYIHT